MANETRQEVLLLDINNVATVNDQLVIVMGDCEYHSRLGNDELARLSIFNVELSLDNIFKFVI